MRKILSLLLGLNVLIGASTVVFANTTENTPIFINGEMKAKGFIENGTTHIPVRSVSETLGAVVDWDSKTKIVTITKDTRTVTIDKPKIIKSTTYVPLRFVSEKLGAMVEWDSKNRIVKITQNGVGNLEDQLKEKYINLSAKTRDMTEFKAVPVTNYTTWDKVPQNARGYRFDKIRFAEMKDMPLKIGDHDIYNLEIDTLDNNTEVFVITIRVINRNLNLPIVYGTKEKGLLVKRDTNIVSATEEVVKISDGEWIVRQKYHLPNQNRDGVTPEQVEYFIFYNSLDMDSIAIKNPYYKNN